MSRHTARPSQMVNQFAQLPSANIPRSAFRRDHGYKCTLDSGYLVPIYCDEVLPGDTFKVRATILARLATPVVPFMDNLVLETHFFYVPNRILWEHFVNMMGEQQNPGDSTDYICPVDTAPASTGFAVGNLYDYFGVPTGVPGIEVNALFRRAYYRIWNEWFRDENLQDSDVDGLEVGDSGQTKDFTLKKRNKYKDYFTSALPWPQKGPASSIGLAGNIPITVPDVGATITPKNDLIAYALNSNSYLGSGANAPYGDLNRLYWNSNTGEQDSYGIVGPNTLQGNSVSDNTNWTVFSGPILSGDGDNAPKYITGQGSLGDGNPLNMPALSSNTTTGVPSKTLKNVGFKASIAGLTANMSEVGLLDINSIREAFQIQKLLEKDARGGSRYVEQNIVHFGVRSPDARLQRPEYLGGSRTPININAVAQTSSTNATTPQGNLSAYGVALSRFHGFTKSFVEHGIVLGLASIRADLSYQQGLHKKWSRSSRFDFYYPVFAHLGEQAILNKEIYTQGPAVLNDDNKPVDDDVFGYQERYAEYRYSPSIIAGKMRSTYAQSLDVWHLAQKFENLPTLSSQFIEENPPVDRVIAVQNEPQFILDAYFNETAIRPMPMYSVPGLVDHF